jgi:hypothetical protein
MNKFSLLIVLTASIAPFSTISHAANAPSPLDAIGNAHTGANAYEILKKLYSSAAQPARLVDFDYANTDTDLKCAIADDKSDVGDTSTPVLYDIVTKPAIPSEGPLLPGEPAQKKTIVTFEGQGIDIDTEASITTMSSTPTDLIVTLTDSELGSDSPDKIFFRKNGAYLAIKSVVGFGTPAPETDYGYCWRQ